MKAALFLFLANLFYYVNCSAQVYVNDIPIDTVGIPFIQLIGSNGGDLNRTAITIDYGQGNINTGFSRQKIAGPDRRPINFKSTVDAVNFVVNQGWELSFFDSSAPNVYVYIFRRARHL